MRVPVGREAIAPDRLLVWIGELGHRPFLGRDAKQGLKQLPGASYWPPRQPDCAALVKSSCRCWR